MEVSDPAMRRDLQGSKYICQLHFTWACAARATCFILCTEGGDSPPRKGHSFHYSGSLRSLQQRDSRAPEIGQPRVEVPVLIDGDLQIFDSTIILEYIEDKWPEPALRPTDPAARAQARMIEEVCDTEYEAVNWGIEEIRWFKRAEGDLAKELEKQGKHHIDTIQTWLTEKLGSNPWFGGDGFGWADAAVAPIVNRSVTWGLGPAAHSPLAQWHSRLKDRPSVAQTFAEYEAGLPGMQAGAKAFQDGTRKREYRSQRLEWMIKAGGIDVVAEGLRKDNIRFTWPQNV